VKLWARVRCLVFLTHSVDLLLTLTLTRRFVIGRRTASKRTEMFTTSVHFARLRNYNTGATESSDHPVGQVDVRKIHGGTSGQTSPSLGDLHRSHAVTDRYIQYTRSHQPQNPPHSPPPPPLSGSLGKHLKFTPRPSVATTTLPISVHILYGAEFGRLPSSPDICPPLDYRLACYAPPKDAPGDSFREGQGKEQVFRRECPAFTCRS